MKRVASANAASVAHSLSSAYPGCWCIGHASCDRAAVLWPKDTNLSVTDCLVSSSCVIPKHVEATYSPLTAEHEIFGKTASLRQVAISNKLADPIWRTYEALRAQQVQESESLQQGKACFRSLLCRFAAVRRLSMNRLGPPCLQVGEADRQLDNQESCLSCADTCTMACIQLCTS